MKVAVMMAAYNAERYLQPALDSLLRQRTAVDLRIVVVDDGSTDATPEILRRNAEATGALTIVTTPNRGLVATRNLGLASLPDDADLVTWLDSDDLSPDGRLARDVACFVREPALQMHYGYMRAFRGDLADPSAIATTCPYADVRSIHLGTMLARRELIESLGGFDPAFKQAEDTDFILRLIERQPRLKLVDDVTYCYRRHDSNITLDTAQSRRDFARALMASARRRKSGAPPVPPGFFDGKNMLEGIDWY